MGNCHARESTGDGPDLQFTDINAEANAQNKKSLHSPSPFGDSSVGSPAPAQRYIVTVTEPEHSAAHTGKLEESKEQMPAPVIVTVPLTASIAETKKLDPKDFIVSNRINETIVRLPSQISGQSFIIEDCRDCMIWLCDYSAAINIDACHRCRIYIGPCESSVFIRDCNDCQFIVAAQQVRLRDCRALSLSLSVSASQPVIETSSNIAFTGHCLSYEGIEEHFALANLNPFNSQWSNIYDFNRTNTANKSDKNENYHYLPYDRQLIRKDFSSLAEVTKGALSESSVPVTPWTWGLRPHDRSQSVLVTISYQHRDAVYRLMSLLANDSDSDGDSENPSIKLIRTKFNHKDRIVGLEYNGANMHAAVISAIDSSGLDRKLFTVYDETKSRELIDGFFEFAQI